MESMNDIIAEMKSLGDKWTADPGWTTMECTGLIIWQLARRLEAAWEREGGSVTDCNRSVGNAAAIRSALVRIVNWFDEGGWDEGAEEEMDSMLEAANTALAKPPRNCDVGTAEEQFKCYLAFCHSESRGCKHCPANRTRVRGTSNCDLAWAQMPYAKEGGAK